MTQTTTADRTRCWTSTRRRPPTSTRARGHRSSIEVRLDNWLGVKEMFETGSLRHGTGVWFYSDVDYIVSLKGQRRSDNSLEQRARALKDKFKTTNIRVGRPAVVCDFACGDETVEVVPAFE